jgi:hypothetical protein
MNSIKYMCEMFWDLETRYDLLDWEVQGTKIWQYLRMRLFFSLAERTGLLDKPHHGGLSGLDRLRNLPRYLYNAARYNPFAGDHTVDAVVLEHPRSKLVDGRYVDICSYPLTEQLERAGKSTEILERPYLGRHLRETAPNRRYLDYFSLWATVRKTFSTVNLTGKEKELIDRLETEIALTAGIEFSLKTTFLSAIRHFRAYYALFHRYFEKRQPQKLYLVVSYGQGEAVKAAKDLGIEVVELQHGAFSPCHLGYSFPARTAPLDYFPDTFLVWDDMWKDAAEIPLPRGRIQVYGFSHFERQIDRYRNVQKSERQLLVLSQGSISCRIADLLWQNRERLSEYDVVYKLHPGEYGRTRTNKSLARLSELPNFTVVEDADLYHLFARSTWQVGVYSTAIYEGMAFGCRTVLMNLPGIEYTEHLLKRDDVCTFSEFLDRSAASKSRAAALA